MGGRVMTLAAAAAFLLALPAFGQTDQMQPRQVPKPNVPQPGPYRPLPDVEVTNAHFALVSTELGQSGVEFPKDTVRFTAQLKNVGPAPCPKGGSYHIQLTRNRVSIANSTATDLLGARGSTYAYSFVDTIVHGAAKELTYRITVTPGFAQASTANDSAFCMGYEGMLHGFGYVDFAVTDFTSSFVDGPGGRTFYFVVKVRNNSLRYLTIGCSPTVYLDRADHSHAATFSNFQNAQPLPDPLRTATLTFSRKGSELPAGSYAVHAVLEITPDDGDPIRGNNTSPQSVVITNPH
ncbi:MAG TPA: hypothetical protein VMT19_13240 [Thermoanaerobaculaceae bacterium]|nr:hypothetical protein [Thermoanaerobaculaceae bacterium]